MNLAQIILELRARCTAQFGTPARVGGAAEFRLLPEAANLTVPAAYVLPLDENVAEQQSETDYLQIVTDNFAVIVVLSNVADERGQAAANNVHDMRAALWAALLGLQIPPYDAIQYAGGQVLQVDRARLYYQFEFSADYTIDRSDTRQDLDLAALPAFTKLHLDVDAIDPMALPSPGPDTRIEHVLEIDPPQ